MILVKIFVFIFITITSVLLLSLWGGKKTVEMNKFIPDEIDGWSKLSEDKIYTQDTIFDYMNGAGEIYRSYNFRKLLVRQLTKPSQPTITVEIFDMGSSEDAFGIFTHGCELGKENIGIGQGAEYKGGLLCFWQDNFFICIHSEKETSSSKKTILELGRTIASSINTTGTKPKLLEYLPRKNLIEKSIRYFHNHTSLNHHYFVSDQNILNLSEQTDAILAKYEDGSYLLCVQYPNKRQAKSAYNKFVDVYLPELKNTGITQLEDGKWTSVKLHQKFVIVVFDAKKKEFAETLLEAVIEKIR